MMLLLCPDCLQWREPSNDCCPICGRGLDVSLPDLSLEEVAAVIGDWRESLGAAEVSRKVLPTRGELHTTTNGLLFVPHVSSVFSFDEPVEPPGRERALARAFLNFMRRIVVRDDPSSSANGRQRVVELKGRDRQALAELLMSEPGVLFVARRSIVHWRRQRRRWEFIRSDARWLPERFTLRGRDGDRRLQNWLETTAHSVG